jgi:hypothetical protein
LPAEVDCPGPDLQIHTNHLAGLSCYSLLLLAPPKVVTAGYPVLSGPEMSWCIQPYLGFNTNPWTQTFSG